MKKIITLFLAFFALTLSAQSFTISGSGCIANSGSVTLNQVGTLNGKPLYQSSTTHTVAYDGDTHPNATLECHWNGTNWRINRTVDRNNPVYSNGSNTATPPTSGWSNFNGCSGTLLVGTILPVELTAFAANTEGGKANLTWATANEKGNAYFAIEHATNGVDFREIAQVKGNGTTSQASKYQYTHTTPAAGANYYRLRQVDADGNATYSAVRFVSVGIKGTASLFPTVGQNDITLITDNTDAAQNYEVYDMLGALVMSGTVQGQKTLHISTLSHGMYIVKISGNTLKFIKD